MLLWLLPRKIFLSVRQDCSSMIIYNNFLQQYVQDSSLKYPALLSCSCLGHYAWLMIFPQSQCIWEKMTAISVENCENKENFPGHILNILTFYVLYFRQYCADKMMKSPTNSSQNWCCVYYCSFDAICNDAIHIPPNGFTLIHWQACGGDVARRAAMYQRDGKHVNSIGFSQDETSSLTSGNTVTVMSSTRLVFIIGHFCIQVSCLTIVPKVLHEHIMETFIGLKMAVLSSCQQVSASNMPKSSGEPCLSELGLL